MVEILTRLNPADLAEVLTVGLLIVVVGLVALVSVAIGAFTRFRERQIASTVVLEMLDRGIATEEIIKVLRAMGLERTIDRRIRARLRQLLTTPQQAAPRQSSVPAR